MVAVDHASVVKVLVSMAMIAVDIGDAGAAELEGHLGHPLGAVRRGHVG